MHTHKRTHTHTYTHRWCNTDGCTVLAACESDGLLHFWDLRPTASARSSNLHLPDGSLSPLPWEPVACGSVQATGSISTATVTPVFGARAGSCVDVVVGYEDGSLCVKMGV
jgi:hypothetical protein